MDASFMLYVGLYVYQCQTEQATNYKNNFHQILHILIPKNLLPRFSIEFQVHKINKFLHLRVLTRIHEPIRATMRHPAHSIPNTGYKCFIVQYIPESSYSISQYFTSELDHC